ncbi:hypothetical protein AOLI_G00110080 [Acnodon oligacanthus]
MLIVAPTGRTNRVIRLSTLLFSSAHRKVTDSWTLMCVAFLGTEPRYQQLDITVTANCAITHYKLRLTLRRSLELSPRPVPSQEQRCTDSFVQR